MLKQNLFGTAVIALLSAQAHAADSKKTETKWQCEKKSATDNSCSSADASCASHGDTKEVIDATNKADCKTKGGEWKKVKPEQKKS